VARANQLLSSERKSELAARYPANIEFRSRKKTTPTELLAAFGAKAGIANE
jgi:hypothetical protein